MVPAQPSFVSVIGSVYNPSTFLYRRDKSVSDYLAQAGGETNNADEKSMYVLMADGSVLSRRQSGWLTGFNSRRLMPGDVIVVPEQLDKTSWMKDLKDWSQIFYQFGLGAAALKVLK